MTEQLRSIFRPGQRSGHQRSPNIKFCRFQHFSTNSITREPEELERPGKAHSIALLTLFRKDELRFDLRFLRFGLKRAKTLKIAFFGKKSFSVITFDSIKTRHSFCQHRISILETRRMNFNLTSKYHSENLTSGEGWMEKVLNGKGHVAYLSIGMIVLNTAMVFSFL